MIIIVYFRKFKGKILNCDIRTVVIRIVNVIIL